MNRTNHPFHLLVIEDNAPDAELLRYFLSRTDTSLELHFVKDGVEGHNFLFRKEGFENARVPDLILMDLNLPKKDGRELLKEVKSSRELCKVPVIMFTTSSSNREVEEAYCLGASAFVTKPIDVNALQELVKRLVDFWFGCALLATRPEKNR